MPGDLGMGGCQVEVRREAGRVLDFWFGLPTEKHFAKDAALDREIADRFGPLRDAVLASAAAGWRDDPDTLLAAIVLLDQFSRNLHRGLPEAFAADDLAVALTSHAIDRGWEGRYPPDRRVFLYMPLMHAEDLSLQHLSVDRFTALGDPGNLAYAVAHRDAIAAFGRFPGRNAALGRETTAGDREWLDANGGGW